VFDRKAGVTPLISNYTPLGNHFVYDANDGNTPPAFSYSDGTSASSTFAQSMLYVFGQNDGYQITVPADTNQRTLQLYTGVEFGQAKITAFLSDGSSPVVSDDSLNSTVPLTLSSNFNNGVYSITYSAASAGQSLTVHLTLEQSYSTPVNGLQLPSGELYLMAAALSGPPPVPLAPAIASVQPSTGAAGTSFTITGSGFGSVQNDAALTLNGVPAVITSWNDGQILANVPSLPPGAYPVMLYGVTGPLFTVVPAITSLVPNSGPVGSSVTIFGSGFGSSQGTGTVNFNGIQAAVNSWTDGFILAIVPSGATSGNVVVTTDQAGLTSGASFTVLPSPVIATVSPNSGAPGTQVSITGSNFGASQGTGSIQIGSQLLPVLSWSDGVISAFIAAGTISGNIVVTSDNGGLSDPVPFAVSYGAPLLQISVRDTPLQVNLTSPQTLDWVHWGRISATLPDRKAGTTPLISDYAPFNGPPLSPASGFINFSWSDGQQDASLTDVTSDLEGSGSGTGFQMTVPADTSVKTLNLYVEVFNGQGLLQASLSDGSAASIADQSIIDSDTASKVYSIDFRAASAGQTLTISFSALSGAVGLQAATLTQHLPSVLITSPASGQSFPAPATVSVNASATQFDDAITDLKAVGSEGTVLDVAGPVLSAPWGPLNSGHYSVTATATDAAGLFNIFAPLEFDVIGQGGSLSINENPIPPSPINLDTQGAADWVLWGPVNNGDTIINNPSLILTRKSAVAPLISDYKEIGNHPISSSVFAHNICFTGDQQNYCSGSEISVHGLENGFEIKVAADTNPRTLQLYVGITSGDGHVTAFLSDGSAPVASEVGGSGPPPPPPANTTLYTINYNAASSGQTLTVRFTLDSDQGGGQVTLIGAALSGSSTAPAVPAPQLLSINPSTAAVNTQVMLAGSNFGSSQGSGTVLFGQAIAPVVKWTDTSITASVPDLSDGSSVLVAVSTDHGISNAVSFTVPTYKIFPASLNLVIGQSASVVAKDSSGNITGLSWTAADPTIVKVSTDDPPIITGLAPGSTKVYAGDVPFPVTVYAGTSLPPGTPIWSLPVGSGSGNISLAAAVPSDRGADVFALDDSGTLTAVSSDGNPVWTITGVPGGSAASIIPDFSGTTLLSTPLSSFDGQHFHSTHIVKKADPSTGLTDLYTFSEQQTTSGDFSDASATHAVIPHPSGPIFIQDNDNIAILDPSTGLPITNLTLQSSSLTIQTPEGTTNFTSHPTFGRMIVAGDSNAYLPYAYTVETDTQNADNTGTSQIVTHSMVLRISPDGSNANTELKNWTFTSNCAPFTDSSGVTGTACNTSGPTPSVSYQSVITNADNGAAVFTTTALTHCTQEFFGVNMSDTGCPTDTQSHVELTYLAQDAVASQVEDAVVLPNDSGRLEAFVPALQREDGSYIGTDTTSEVFGYSNLVAVAASGGILFKQPLSSSPMFLTPLYATADGGMIVQSKQVQNCQTNPDRCDTAGTPLLYTVDQNGNVTAQASDGGIRYSWKGAYLAGPGVINSVDVDYPAFASSFGGISHGNITGNGASLGHQSFGLAWCGTNVLGGLSGCGPRADDMVFVYRNYCQATAPDQDFSKDHPEWITLVEDTALATFKQAFAKYPISVVNASKDQKTTWAQCQGDPNCVNTNIADQNHVVRVAGNLDPSSVGYTYSAFLTPPPGVDIIKSDVYYHLVMQYAETAWWNFNSSKKGWCPKYPPTTNADTQKFLMIMRTIGIGIGNASAHEIGHQLPGFPFMDCGPPDTPAQQTCQPKDGKIDNFVYNFYLGNFQINDPNNPNSTANGGRFFYELPGDPLIHWGQKNDCYLTYWSTHTGFFQTLFTTNPCTQ